MRVGISESIVFGFKEILNWHVLKYILFAGTVVTLIWIGIGAAMWDGLVALGAKVTELVPFSLVRSNGAWMLSTFLWLQLTLITFALVYAFFGNLIMQKVDRKSYTTFSLTTLAGSAIFWGVVWFAAGDKIYDAFVRLLTWLPFETVEKGLAYLIGLYIVYNGIVVTMLFVASAFSKPMAEAIEIREFAEDDVVRDNTFKTLRYTLKDTLLFAVVSIVLFPLLFVPVLNIFVQLALWVWLSKDTMSYDALALTHKEVTPDLKKRYRGAIWTITIVTVLFYLVPVLNLFGPFFGILALFYYFKHAQANSVG